MSAAARSTKKSSQNDVENATIKITLEHHMIHDGNHYIVDDYDGDVDTAVAKYWLLKTPNSTVRIHVFFKGGVSAASLFQLFENPTITANGTGLTEVNNDRNSSKTATLQVFKDPTVGGDGTQIMVGYIGSGQGPKAVGGVDQRAAELILKQNEEYLVKVTVDNNDTKVTISMTWYEVS